MWGAGTLAFCCCRVRMLHVPNLPPFEMVLGRGQGEKLRKRDRFGSPLDSDNKFRTPLKSQEAGLSC